MTLTEAAFWTKRFGVIGVGAFFIFTVTVLILTLRPPEPPIPKYQIANYACTQTREEFLEHKLEIPSLQLATGSEMSFQIDTNTGKIEDSLPDIINVYRFSNPTQSVTAQADAKVMAEKLGFNPDGIIRRNAESYVWVNNELDTTLEIQAKNLNFKFKTEAARIRTAARESALPSEQEAKNYAAGVLRTLGAYPEDYSKGDHRTTYIKVNPDGSFRKASAPADADLIKVDFVRSKGMITIESNIVGAERFVQTLSRKIEEPPIIDTPRVNDKRIEVYTFNTLVSFPETQRSNITVYVGAANPDITDSTLKYVYQIDYTFWPTEVESCGTYELITPQVAIEKVQAGEGSLVYLYETNGDDVVEYTPREVKKFHVFDIFIVYYEDRTELEYLQPVYVVSGEAIFDNDTKGLFDFFYPAINYDIVQNKIELPEPEVEQDSDVLF
jgi:hypothetical protein